ncbi:MAG: cytochrome c biogenesis protein CcsA [Saprospiraceae bacterium]
MDEIQYVNEHLAAGAIGRAAVVLGFVCALLALIAGIYATQAQRKGIVNNAWQRILGTSFGVMGLSVIGIIVLLLTMMTNHWYEYQYVQQHVNDELPFRYVFTAFWEGQEGSFLLWLFWHSVLGGVVWFTGGKWRAPVLTVIASVQLVLLSMLLGVYLPFGEDFRLGSSPFLLLREVMDIPIFNQADYVDLIDGTGLNPLLQNYWMIIHPPTLFLGFASTVVPFAYAVAALWIKDHKGWLTPVLRWSLFSGGILGIGILMGGAWAYEALNFGGYWAWDPVENTSLVPWLLMVAGIHTNLVARSTGHSIKATYIFYLLGFVAVLYSSFLTRSGVLGETSVHAFTEMGLENQLLFLVVAFFLMGLVFLVKRWTDIPVKDKEEAASSREFWMFLGSLVLLFSGAMILASTSLPVFNKISDFFEFGMDHLTINEPVAHYNKYQLWVGAFMGLFTAIGQYFRWKGGSAIKGGSKKLMMRMGIAVLISGVLAAVTYSALAAIGWQFAVLAFAAYFAVFSNLDYLFSSKVALWQRLGSVSGHLGFGMMIIGILFSGLNQHQISKNTFAMDGLLGEEQIGKNVLIVKGLPMVINGYEVTYISDTLVGNRRDYRIQYRELSREGKIGNQFVLSPYALYTNDFAKVASMNPDTKHYWDHDVFTHITGLPPGAQSADLAKAFEDSLNYQRFPMTVGASIETEKHRLTLLEVNEQPVHPDYEPEPGDLAIGLKVKLERLDFDTVQYAEPVVVLRENLVYSYPTQINPFSARIQVPEDAFTARFGAENQLDYQDAQLKPGESISVGEYTFRFDEFDGEASHPNYKREDGDVAVNAKLSVLKNGEVVKEMNPLFYIRDNEPRQVKAFDAEFGLHARLAKIDPATSSAVLAVAVSNPAEAALIPIELAENASRSDWVVLEATVFPGINLFWIGTIMMLGGLLIAMSFRISERRKMAKLAKVEPTISQAKPTATPRAETVG